LVNGLGLRLVLHLCQLNTWLSLAAVAVLDPQGMLVVAAVAQAATKHQHLF